MHDDVPLALLAVFVPFSLVSIGGGTSIIAGIQHQAVDVHHWVTAREFVELFAIARAAPGPGLDADDLDRLAHRRLVGRVVATLALFVPSSLLCYGVAPRVAAAPRQALAHRAGARPRAGRHRPHACRRVVDSASSGGGVVSYALAFGSAALLTWRPKLHPLLLFVIGGGIAVAVRIALS